MLTASHLPTDQVGYYFHPTVVNTGSKLVLLDTGNGPGSLQAGTGLTRRPISPPPASTRRRSTSW